MLVMNFNEFSLDLCLNITNMKEEKKHAWLNMQCVFYDFTCGQHHSSIYSGVLENILPQKIMKIKNKISLTAVKNTYIENKLYSFFVFVFVNSHLK